MPLIFEQIPDLFFQVLRLSNTCLVSWASPTSYYANGQLSLILPATFAQMLIFTR